MTPPAFLRAPRLRDAGIEHGFGTRASESAAPADVLFARQVHGTRTLEVPPAPAAAEADALFSRRPGTAVGVRTADCVPLVVAAPDGRGVLVIHAGWRGSAARICEAAVRAFTRGARVEPSELLCAIGPHIGPCCYEVDEPVRRAIAEECAFRPAARAGHFLLDLYEVNRLQLLVAGARADRIERVGSCTACTPEWYASFRRDRTPGRMVHWARVSTLTRESPDVPSCGRSGRR